jgi:hypothetical protein
MSKYFSEKINHHEIKMWYDAYLEQARSDWKACVSCDWRPDIRICPTSLRCPPYNFYNSQKVILERFEALFVTENV